MGTFLAVVALAVSIGGISALGLLLIGWLLLFALYAAGVVVVGVAYVIGLPLRFWARARNWWAEHAWLPWVLAVAGAVLLVVARVVAVPELWIDDEGFENESLNVPPALGYPGILLLAFGLLWVPQRAKEEALPGEAVGGDGVPVDR